jgi:agmatine deiminase
MTPTVPAEWAPHRAMWVGFPSHAELWSEDLPVAQKEVADLARALAGPGAERVRLMVVGDEAEAAASALLSDTSVEIVRGTFGDIWLRDTGPIFIETADGPIAAGFEFNGWGGKFEMEGDDIVAEQIAAASGTPLARNGFVLEGGSLDHDGMGTMLTTRQCLLNENRNGDFDRGQGLGRPRQVAGRQEGAVAGGRPAQRPHRRSHRQPGPLRRARRGGLSDGVRRR